MTNKKIKRATGSYTQELVNNQPVVPTVPVQNPTVATGGNSYQAYVNSGAPKTPVQTSSVVTPVQNPTVPMEGQYTRNLVKPKQMKNEVGGVETGGEVVDTGGDGVETGGEKKLEVEDPNSYIAALREREESIVDQYNADINYAEQLKDEAYKKAEDQYNIAMREAQGNFRANQPTYGAKAEQLLASGLTGGGYSDYLGGKAYEARTDEINAARSQLSYAEQLADSNYRDMMHKAEQDKFDRQYANDQWKLEYGVQLDAEYKAKVDEVLTGIKAGNINAEVAETILKNYAPNGEISESVLNALKTQEEGYWRDNNNSVTTDFISWVAAREDAEKPVNAAGMRQWLKDNTNLTDDEVEFWIATYTDKDGNYQPPTNISYEVRNGNLWISTDGGKTWKDYGALSDKGEVKVEDDTGGTGGSANNAKDEDLSEAVKYLREAAKNGLSGADAYNAFKTAMNKHDIGDYNSYKQLLDEVDRLVTEGKFDADVAAKMKDMTNGLVVGSGVFEENRGLRKKFQDGDNFTVNVNGFSYKVESGGEADSKVIEAAKDLKDGVVFGYGSELYLKSGDTAYKIEPRPVFGNKDYDKLWSAVYGEAINNIAEGKGFVQSNEGKATDKKSIKEDNLLDWGEKQDGTYEEEDVPEVPKNDNNIQSDAAASAGVNIGSRILEAMKNMFKGRQDATKNNAGKFFDLFNKNNNEGNPDDDNISLEGTVTKGYDAEFKNDAWGIKKDLSKGDNFNIEVNGKTYRVESGGKIDNSGLIDVFEGAGIGNDEVFEYDGQAYLKRNDNYYSIDTRFLMGKQEEKLLDAIEYNPNSAISAAVNLKGTTVWKNELNKEVEDQAFIKGENGTGVLRMTLPDGTDKGFIELTYEEIEDKKVPSGLINEMKSSTLVDGYQDINVVYWNGNFYLNDGTYYKITPASDEYKEKLLKAMTTAENQTNNNEE